MLYGTNVKMIYLFIYVFIYLFVAHLPTLPVNQDTKHRMIGC